ncbi:E3 ubiquitin-protein ligase RAD18-like [Periplaneta americana]|uniref:E3 ubiquitin-protein ligase RAD18-like n=1 Tax=Periplaneta americana TaxID=6978 RepID=UPI0037E7AE99
MADLDVEIPTDIPALKELDSLLRCGICYEHMKTSMVTSCSHNYCSICIRRSLVYRTQCPSCSTEAFDHQLRNNRIIDSIIEVFFKLLNEVKKCSKDAKDIPISAVKLTPDLSEEPVRKLCLKNNEPVGDVRKCVAIDGRNKAVLKTYNSIEVPSTSTHIPETVTSNSVNVKRETSTQKMNEISTSTKVSSRCEQQIPSMFSPKKLKIILVACPVCSVDIPEKNINAHLDACLKRCEQPVQSSSPLKMQKRKPLPKLVYSLLQDKELKKKLKEHGLSTQGDRKTLVNRHQRFTLLYNSECDVLNPRSVVDLIKQLEKEEQEEKRVTSVSTSSKLKIDRKTDPKLIENANQEYIQQHKSSYEMLIQSIKKRDEEKKHSSQQDTSKTQKENSSKRISDDDIIEIVNKEEPPVKNNIADDEDEDSVCYSPLSNVGMEVSENAENFDVSYNSSDGAVSPILGKTSISLKNESVCMRRSVTPDLFQQSSESPSLLSDFMLEPALRNENESIVSAASVKAKTEKTPKRLNSHLEGSDFEELSDDFDIRKPRRRNARKFPETSPSVCGSPKRRVLRKRTKY